MNYGYHVDVHIDNKNIERTFTTKWKSFTAAYDQFINEVQLKLDLGNYDSWSVTLYDVEANEIKLCITDTDFTD